MYSGSLVQASSLAGGHNQSNSTLTSIVGTADLTYALGSSWYLGASYEHASQNEFGPLTTLNALPQAYLAFSRASVASRVGNQLFTSPWANPHLSSLLPPMAFQGVDVAYTSRQWSFEAAQMVRFMSPAATSLTRTTLLTPDIQTPGFSYARVSLAPTGQSYSLSAFAYNVPNLVAMGWFSGTLSLKTKPWTPSLALQGGFENAVGASYLGKVRSSAVGALLSIPTTKNLTIALGVDRIPWRRDYLPSNGALCDDEGKTPTYQLTAPKSYFLPQGVAQCGTIGKTTSVYYGGWASPYTDGYSADPLFTTALLEGMVDRRSPGNSQIVRLAYNARRSPIRFYSGFSWYDYTNALASEQTQEWDTVAAYRLPPIADRTDPDQTLVLRLGYSQLRKSNVAYASGASFLGSVPQLRFAWMQVDLSL